jgi:hypothetical protein
MGFEFAKVISELGECVIFGAELESGENGFVDLAGTPCPELGAAVEQDFHEAKQAGVLDLDAGDFGVSRGDGQSQTLEQGKLDMDIQSVGLEFSEAIGDGSQSLFPSYPEIFSDRSL